MNEIVETMKQQVGTLLQQGEPLKAESSVAPSNGEDKHEASETDPQVSGADEQAHDSEHNATNLSERDRYELDQAVKSGWKSPDEYKGDTKYFIHPREWNRRVALLRRLDKESDRRRNLEKELDGFHERIKNVMEVTRAKTIAELEAQKKQAVEEADYAAVQNIDEQIEKTHDQYEVEDKRETSPELRPEVEEWVAENPWFEHDKEMTEFAVDYQTIQLSKVKDRNNITSEELRSALEKTTKAMKRAFPDKFKLTPKATAPSLEPGSQRPMKHKFGYNDLTAEEKTVLKEVERLGGISRDEYIQAIADMREAGR